MSRSPKHVIVISKNIDPAPRIGREDDPWWDQIQKLVPKGPSRTPPHIRVLYYRTDGEPESMTIFTANMTRSGASSDTSSPRSVRGFAIAPTTSAKKDFLTDDVVRNPDIVILAGPQVEGWRHGNYPSSLKQAVKEASVVIGTGPASRYLFKEFYGDDIETQYTDPNYPAELDYLLRNRNTSKHAAAFVDLTRQHEDQYRHSGLGVIPFVPVGGYLQANSDAKDSEIRMDSTDKETRTFHFVDGRPLVRSPIPPLKSFPPYGFGEKQPKQSASPSPGDVTVEAPPRKRNSITVLGGGTPEGAFDSGAGRTALAALAGMTVENPTRGTGTRKEGQQLKVLYLGIAKGDDKAVDQDLMDAFSGIKSSFKGLGISADVQFGHLARPHSEYLNLKSMINEADLIILGGGRETVRGPVLVEQKIHKWLGRASRRGAVLAGFSDGAIFLSKGSIGGSEIASIHHGEGHAKAGIVTHSEEPIRQKNAEAAIKQGVFKKLLMIGTNTLSIFINGKYQGSLLLDANQSYFDRPPNLLKRVTPETPKTEDLKKVDSTPTQTARPKPKMSVTRPHNEEETQSRSRHKGRARTNEGKGSERKTRRFHPERKGKGYAVEVEELPHDAIDAQEVPNWLEEFRTTSGQIGLTNAERRALLNRTTNTPPTTPTTPTL